MAFYKSMSISSLWVNFCIRTKRIFYYSSQKGDNRKKKEFVLFVKLQRKAITMTEKV